MTQGATPVVPQSSSNTQGQKMVAIVSGMRAGLNLGSREVLGQGGITGSALEGRNGQGVYVNVGKGLLVVQNQDESLASRGADAAVVRTYDARGNLRDVADARAHVVMDYDLVGNRTRVATFVDYQGVSGETAASTDRYFKFDAMNRQIVVDAVDAAGNLGQQGHAITYDKNGNRTSDTYWGPQVAIVGGQQIIVGYNEDGSAIYTTTPVDYAQANGYTREDYRYDNLNRLLSVVKDGTQIDVRYYDGADRVVQSGPAGALPQKYADIINAGLTPEQMNGKETRINRYDANGRLMHQTVRKSDNTLKLNISWDPNEPTTVNGITYYPDGYDNAGNVRGYTVTNHEAGIINEYSSNFARFEGYQGAVTQGVSSKQLPGSTTQNYDPNGYLVSITDSTQARNNRTFVNDASGRALYVNQAGNVQRQLIVNGEVLGLYGVGVNPTNPASGYENNPNFANVVDFDFGYAKVSANYPTPSPGAYTVRAGDTLQSIAQGTYGDSSLWYRIAEANGLASSSDMKVGQTLNIPNRVSTINNNASTFKPYDPSEIEGDKTPSLATPKPKKKSGLGQLLMVIVAIVLTVLTGIGGAIANFLSSSAVGLTGTALTVATGAVTGALVSVATQLVGMATGVVDKFDWKGVALSAISGGIGANLPTFSGLGQVGNAVLRSALGNAITQGIGVATSLQKKFDWRGVAASAVAAGVGQGIQDTIMGREISGPLRPGDTRPRIGGLVQDWGGGDVAQFAGSALKGLVVGVTAAAARGGRVVVQQVVTDAFGNALGESIATGTNGTPVPEAQAGSHDPLGDFIAKNQNWAHVSVGPVPALVNGQTFSEDAAVRTWSNDPYGLRKGADISPLFTMPTTLDLSHAHDQWASTGRKPIYDFGDPFQVDGDGALAQNLVRVVRGAGVRPATVNGISVNSRAEALLNAAAEGDISGMGNLYRDYKLLGGLMNEAMRERTLADLKKQLQDRLGVMRSLPSEEALGPLREMGADGVERYNKTDLIDRYADALRKVGLAQQGVIELDYRSFEVRTIGNAKLTVAQYLAEIETRYQRAFARGVEMGEERHVRGELRYPADMPKQLQVGLFADDFGKRTLLTYNNALGVPEGPGQLISLNRWTYDPQGTGLYIRNDVLVDLGPSQRYWIDGKTSVTEGLNSVKQFETFYRYTGAVRGKVATPQGLFDILPNGKIRR